MIKNTLELCASSSVVYHVLKIFCWCCIPSAEGHSCCVTCHAGFSPSWPACPCPGALRQKIPSRWSHPRPSDWSFTCDLLVCPPHMLQCNVQTHVHQPPLFIPEACDPSPFLQGGGLTERGSMKRSLWALQLCEMQVRAGRFLPACALKKDHSSIVLFTAHSKI